MAVEGQRLTSSFWYVRVLLSEQRLAELGSDIGLGIRTQKEHRNGAFWPPSPMLCRRRLYHHLGRRGISVGIEHMLLHPLMTLINADTTPGLDRTGLISAYALLSWDVISSLFSTHVTVGPGEAVVAAVMTSIFVDCDPKLNSSQNSGVDLTFWHCQSRALPAELKSFQWLSGRLGI